MVKLWFVQAFHFSRELNFKVVMIVSGGGPPKFLHLPEWTIWNIRTEMSPLVPDHQQLISCEINVLLFPARRKRGGERFFLIFSFRVVFRVETVQFLFRIGRFS